MYLLIFYISDNDGDGLVDEDCAGTKKTHCTYNCKAGYMVLIHFELQNEVKNVGYEPKCN